MESSFIYRRGEPIECKFHGVNKAMRMSRCPICYYKESKATEEYLEEKNGRDKNSV